MSDSLENMAEMQSEIDQPNDGVAPELEENTPPQGGTEEMELVIEAEGDQSEEPNDKHEPRTGLCSFREKKKKSDSVKRKSLKQRANRERIADRLAKLRRHCRRYYKRCTTYT